MRILHIYKTYFPDPPGGLQEAIKQIALATKKIGVETKIFTLSPNPQPNTIEFAEATVIRCRSLAAPASCDIGDINAFIKFRELGEWADIIHYHFPWPFADILRLFNPQNKPTVMTYHSDIVRQRYLGYLYEPLMRKTLKSMSKIIATSETYAQTSRILQQFTTKNTLQVIPLGIADYSDCLVEKNDYLSTLSLKPNQAFILSLGVLRYYKGLHVLLAAASKIKAKIVIAGSGSEELSLKELVSKQNISNVIFAGQISPLEKIILLRHCSVFVLASHLRSEAFGMVLVEAAMFAKPMISCELGTGTSFINQHGITGWVIPPESAETLAETANHLLDNPLLAQQMGIAARQRYEKLFSSEVLGKAYSELYKTVS
jgi:glycosyltransferase involved in cell wall biosynthesis